MSESNRTLTSRMLAHPTDQSVRRSANCKCCCSVRISFGENHLRKVICTCRPVYTVESVAFRRYIRYSAYLARQSKAHS